MRLPFVILLTAVTALAAAGAAPASYLVDRNAAGVHLYADDQGRALVVYKAHGQTRRVLAWGAVDARQPDSPKIPQVEFKVDYSGNAAASFRNTCGRYDGPALAWAVTACKASDGSYWALQRWQRALPNAGYRPWKASQTVWELRLSHWSARGGLALLDVHTDWVYGGRFQHLFGRATYQGQAVFGFKANNGNPLDGYGRNVYVDTFDSAYGPGWHRENSFLSHKPSGMFCYGFYPYANYPGYPVQRTVKIAGGAGKRYRITMIGPGVSPDVMWTGNGLQAYDASNQALVAWEQQMNAKLDEMRAAYAEKSCATH